NIIYLLLVSVTLFFAIREYGYTVVVDSIMILYCMFIPILNGLILYLFLKFGKRYLQRWHIIFAIVSMSVYIIIFFGVLSSKWQIGVLIFNVSMIISLSALALIVGFLKK
ncbi:hypothetical protein, partial [Lutibacter sp.]